LRRDKIEIIADILKVALHGAKKTHIVYKANLNFNVLKKYIVRLEENGLLMQINGGQYITTQKGSQFLEQYMKLFV
jgi:predicted transcriptional regulator